MPAIPLIAITRKVSDTFSQCELTHIERERVNLEKAVLQHQAYERVLQELGVEVISLDPDPAHPDSVFVEDTAVVLDEVAIITSMAAESRRREVETVAPLLAKYRECRFLSPPATLDGGDVMQVGQTLYVGRSTRTNSDGIRQLGRYVAEFGWKVVEVDVPGCLHLKTGCTYLGEGTLLASRRLVDLSPFKAFDIVEVAAEEPLAANSLRIGECILFPAKFPRTLDVIRSRHFDVRTIDISELQKAEAGLTCMSLIFNNTVPSND